MSIIVQTSPHLRSCPGHYAASMVLLRQAAREAWLVSQMLRPSVALVVHAAVAQRAVQPG